MKVYVDNAMIRKESTQDLVYYAAKWFGRQRRIGDKVRLIVNGTVYRPKDDAQAECVQWEKNLYCILLDKAMIRDLGQKRFSALQVLFHELEHVHQYHRGDLTIRKGLLHWRGMVVQHLDWDDCPHEQEADDNGEFMARCWLAQQKNRGAK